MASLAVERQLREEMCREHEETIGKELVAINAALWFQCMSALHMDFTMAAFDSGTGFAQTMKTCCTSFGEIFRSQKSLTKSEVREKICKLARFYCSFPPEEEIKGYTDSNYFEPHSQISGSYAITPVGLDYLCIIVRAFWLRRKHLRGLRWEETPTGSSASPVEVKRAIEVALGRGDARATDILLDEVRHRTIGRLMPPHGLYNMAAQSHVSARDLYLVMREIDPDNLNKAHRAGSVPLLLALESKEPTVQQELLVLMVLIASSDVTLHDETSGCFAAPCNLKEPAPGYFCGEYVLVMPGGKLRHGFGGGLAGAVGCVLPLLKKKDKLGYDYITGSGMDFRPSLQEQEYEQSSCF